MANTKYEQIEQMTGDELTELLAETKAILGKMRFNHAVSPLEDSTELRRTKKKIARVLTELRKRELEKAGS